jgi:hypothetical protein
MEVAFARPRRLPSGKSGSSALAGTRLERRTRRPTGAAAARVHRCSKTSTRPFAAPLFAGVFGPRALPRLLQIDVSTSTALDHPNIPYQRNPWSGRLLFSIDRRLSINAAAEGTQGQGPRITEPRRSLPGLLPRETSPQPRSLQTPRVAVIVCRPAWSRRGRPTKPPARRTLARHAQREGRATPYLREEIRRSPTRGAFRREAVRKRGCLSSRASPFERIVQRLFHRREIARGTLARGPEARPVDKGEQRAALLSIGRSAPYDFCVRVEVHG